MGRGLGLEDVSRSKKMYFEQTCVFYIIVSPSVGRGPALEDVFRGKKMYFEQTCVFYLIVRLFGGPRVNTRTCTSRQENKF